MFDVSVEPLTENFRDLPRQVTASLLAVPDVVEFAAVPLALTRVDALPFDKLLILPPELDKPRDPGP